MMLMLLAFRTLSLSFKQSNLYIQPNFSLSKAHIIFRTHYWFHEMIYYQ